MARIYGASDIILSYCCFIAACVYFFFSSSSFEISANFRTTIKECVVKSILWIGQIGNDNVRSYIAFWMFIYIFLKWLIMKHSFWKCHTIQFNRFHATLQCSFDGTENGKLSSLKSSCTNQTSWAIIIGWSYR